MKVLHVTPHLGGGVGKAHAALRGVLPSEVEQTFVLLEAAARSPSRRMLSKTSARASSSPAISIRSRIWRRRPTSSSSSSGIIRACSNALRAAAISRDAQRVLVAYFRLDTPLIPAGLMEDGDALCLHDGSVPRYRFDSVCCRSPRKAIFAVINSGFGFPNRQQRTSRLRDRKPAIAYLGTVDFVKMHPGFFDAIDGLIGDDIRVSVWGEVDPSGPVAARARAMRHPERIKFCGETPEPAAALSERGNIFLSAAIRSLRYGGKRADRSDVSGADADRDGQSSGNGDRSRLRDRVCCAIYRRVRVSILQMLLLLPDFREKISRNAIDVCRGNPGTGAFCSRFHDPLAWVGQQIAEALRFPVRGRGEPRGLVRRDTALTWRELGTREREERTTIVKGDACSFRKCIFRRRVSCQTAAVVVNVGRLLSMMRGTLDAAGSPKRNVRLLEW